MRPDLRAYLLGDEGQRCFGPGPLELLKRVEETGSLRAAASSMNMAYTKATRLVKVAEQCFGFSLTERTIGGAGGGGSRLTAEAHDLLARYEAFERVSRRDLSRNYLECFSGFCDVPRVGCVVMASGKATRFGANKLVEPLEGVPVLERTLSALPDDLLDVVVVTRSAEVEELCGTVGVRCVRHAGAHQSDTVREGLKALPGVSACLFVPGDQPLLTEASVRALVGDFQLHPGSIVRLAWHGVPASPILWPSEELPALAALEGETGGSSLLSRRVELGVRVRLVEAGSELETKDVDTREDLAALEAALRAKGDW